MIDRLRFSESNKSQLILVQMLKHFVVTAAMVTVCRSYETCQAHICSSSVRAQAEPPPGPRSLARLAAATTACHKVHMCVCVCIYIYIYAHTSIYIYI